MAGFPVLIPGTSTPTGNVFFQSREAGSESTLLPEMSPCLCIQGYLSATKHPVLNSQDSGATMSEALCAKALESEITLICARYRFAVTNTILSYV